MHFDISYWSLWIYRGKISRTTSIGKSEGHQIKCVYRRKNPPENLLRLQESGATLIQADLTNIDIFDELLRGVSTVFHAAAIASDWGSYDQFRKANIDATVNLLEKAEELEVKKAIILSSISVHGFGNHSDSTEDGPYYLLTSNYQRSKLEMEKQAIKYNSKKMAVTIIRPGNVYGPGDTITMYPIFNAMKKGYMGYLAGGGKLTCPVYIEDLIDALLSAWKKDKANGQIFNITGGEKVTWKMLSDHSAYHLQIKPPGMNIPANIALTLATILEKIFLIVKSKTAPPLTTYRVSQLVNDYHFCMSKAEKVLDYKPKISLKEGIELTVDHYRKSFDEIS